MRTTRFTRLFPVVYALVAFAAPSFGQKEKEKDKDSGALTIEVPAAVQATIAKEKGDGKVVDFRKINESDGGTYAVGLLIDGKNYALILDPLGRVLRKEIDEEHKDSSALALSDLPPAVKKTFEREAVAIGGTVKEIEVKEQVKTYGSEVVIAGRKYWIEVGADGKLLKKEYTGEEEKEHK